MTRRFEEGSLVLEFADLSRARRWDTHQAYIHGLGKIAPGTKAVVICLWTGARAVVLEVTNYGTARIPFKDLAVEVASKTRDTIASMAWACVREISDEPDYERFVRRFIDCGMGAKLEVVVWLEADRPLDAVDAHVFADEIRAQLKPWIYARVAVTNRVIQTDPKRAVAWLRVTSKNRRDSR